MWLLCCVALAQTVAPQARALDAAAGDQDDLCVWVHPTDPKSSTVIGSDKQTGKIFVYDTAGKTLHTLSDLGMPGNIDVRYGFPLGGKKVDLVAVN